jgi:hypothetical protein
MCVWGRGGKHVIQIPQIMCMYVCVCEGGRETRYTTSSNADTIEAIPVIKYAHA